MHTQKEFTVFQVARVDKGAAKWQLVNMGQVWWTLERARAYCHEHRNAKFPMRILRRPPTECAELLRWLCTPLPYAKAGSKKSYLVVAPMPGVEQGTYWLAGCYETLREAKAHTGHYGELISVIHTDAKRRARFDQPPPVERDLWDLA